MNLKTITWMCIALIAVSPSVRGEEKFTSAEYAISVSAPKSWRSIPAPKELDSRYQQDSSISMLTRFQAPNPDSENYSIVMDLLVMKGETDLERASKSYQEHKNGLGNSFEVEKSLPVKVSGRKSLMLQANRDGGFYENVFLVAGAKDTFVVSFVSGEKYGRKKADAFKEYVKGVSLLSDQQLARLSASGRNAASPLPSGWQSYATPHYDIQYDTDEGFSRLVGKHLEAILKEYQRRFPMEKTMDESGTSLSRDRRFTVKCFQSQDAFNSYASANGVSGAAAYFSPAQNELVCYKTVDDGKKKTLHILYHEASHQYLHLYMGEEADIPIWLNEGVAEYFFGGEFSGEKFAIGVNRERITTIKEAVRRDTFVPLAEIFKYSQAQYYANPEICYAEGWALAHFLWSTTDARYRGRINTFYEELKATKSKDSAFEKAFGDLDLGQMEKDWKSYVLKL